MTAKKKWNAAMLLCGGVMLVGITGLCLPHPLLKLVGATIILLGFIGAVAARIGEGFAE